MDHQNLDYSLSQALEKVTKVFQDSISNIENNDHCFINFYSDLRALENKVIEIKKDIYGLEAAKEIKEFFDVAPFDELTLEITLNSFSDGYSISVASLKVVDKMNFISHMIEKSPELEKSLDFETTFEDCIDFCVSKLNQELEDENDFAILDFLLISNRSKVTGKYQFSRTDHCLNSDSLHLIFEKIKPILS